MDLLLLPGWLQVDIDEDLLEEVEESEDAETAESYLQTEAGSRDVGFLIHPTILQNGFVACY